MHLITTSLVLAALSLAGPLVSTFWSFEDVYDYGLENMSLSFNISKVAHKSGYIFAQQFNFIRNDGLTYMSIEPREDSNGKSIVHAVYKTFIDRVEIGWPTCYDGADGGPGVTCELDIPVDYNHKLTLSVNFYGGTGDRYFMCTLTDEDTGDYTVVGEILLPVEGNVVAEGQGYIDYLPWEIQSSSVCDQLPEVEVTFFDTASYSVEGTAASPMPEEVGDCAGKEGFSVSRATGGWDIKLGF